jgi:hypothetical protein
MTNTSNYHEYVTYEIKRKKYHTVKIIPKSIKITERDKSIPIIFNDMTAHFPSWDRHFNQ